MVLKWKILPLSTLSNGKRPHHFVYGNFLIILTSFLVIGLGIDPENTFVIVAYGIGIGLILDEFPHWMGSVKELTRNVPLIPGAIPAIIASELTLLLLIILKYLDVI